MLNLYIYDRKISGLAYNVSELSDLFALAEQVESSGFASTLNIPLYSTRAGFTLPIVPTTGMEIVLADDAGFPGAPDPNDYLFAGKIMSAPVTDMPGAATLKYNLVCTDFTPELKMPLLKAYVDYQNYPNDKAVLMYLLSAAGLPGTWSTSLIYGPYATYTAPGSRTYSGKLIDLLNEIANYPGSVENALPRKWAVTAKWSNPANKNLGLTRYLYYYQPTSLPVDPVPLTDAADGVCDFANDNFNRANSATTLGTAATGQVWSTINGSVWGVTGGTAYLVSTASNQSGALINFNASDFSYSLRMVTFQSQMRMLFRVTPGGTGGYQGWMVEGASSSYQLRYYTGVGSSLVATGGGIPANGDTLRVVTAGNLITVYLTPGGGGSETQIIQYTDTLARNTTATYGGLGGSTTTPTARWGNLQVRAVGAVYSDRWQYTPDAAALGNIVGIIGPGFAPAPVNWTNAVNVSTKPGYIVRTSSPPFADAGAVSDVAIAEDGGEVVVPIERIYLARDSFDRANDYALGSTQTGQAWTQTAPVSFGIQNNAAYITVWQTPQNEGSAVITTGVPSGVIETAFETVAVGARVIFRQQDDNNKWVLQSEATRWSLYERNAGTYTNRGNYNVTPTANSVVKIDLRFDTIIVTINGATAITYNSDTILKDYHIHGIGVDANNRTARWSYFNVYTLYGRKIFGLDSSDAGTTEADVEYGIQWDNRALLAWASENGVQAGGTQSFIENDKFKVQAVYNPATAQYDIKYWKYTYATRVWSLFHTSASHPNLATTPYNVDVAVFQHGAGFTGMTIERYNGTIYRSAASISAYAEWPANDFIVDDTLDSKQKRDSAGQEYLNVYSDLRRSYEVITKRKYRGGNLVLFNHSKLGLTNVLKAVARVRTDRSNRSRSGAGANSGPLYILTLDSPARMYGERPLFSNSRPTRRNFISAISINPPALFGPGVVTPGRNNKVAQELTWGIPDEDIDRIEVWMQRVGGGAGDDVIRQFPASTGAGVIEDLPDNSTYVAYSRFYPKDGGPPSEWAAQVEIPLPANTTATDIPVYDTGGNRIGALNAGSSQKVRLQAIGGTAEAVSSLNMRPNQIEINAGYVEGSGGYIVLGGGSAEVPTDVRLHRTLIPTGSNTGFVFLPSMEGAPTGEHTQWQGLVTPFVVDRLNKRLYYSISRLSGGVYYADWKFIQLGSEGGGPEWGVLTQVINGVPSPVYDNNNNIIMTKMGA